MFETRTICNDLTYKKLTKHVRRQTRTGAQAHHGAEGGMDPRCSDDRDSGASHLTPHALLIPFDFLLQCSLVRDVPRCHLGRGMSHVHEGERGSGERVGRGGG